MDRLTRRTVPAMLALLALALTTGVVVAGDEEGEPVVFELTLAGDVDSDDSFSIFHQCATRNECVFIHDLSPLCTSDEQINAAYGMEPCEARTYRVTYERAVGDEITYAIAFWDEEFNGVPEHLLSDSVTVPNGGITLRLRYDYSLGAQLAAPTTPQALPDTAAPSSGGGVAIGVLMVVMSLLLWRLPTAQRRGRT